MWLFHFIIILDGKGARWHTWGEFKIQLYLFIFKLHELDFLRLSLQDIYVEINWI